MINKLLAAAALSAAIVAPAGAAIVTVDFGGLTYDNNYSPPYVEKGFTFATTGNHTDGDGELAFHDSGNNDGENEIVLTSAGGLFDLISFDALYVGLQLILTTNDGQTLNFAAGTTGTQMVNLQGLTSVTFSNGAGVDYNQAFNTLDNLVLNDASVPVPEPAMLGLFGLGAIGLGLSRRRKAA